MMAKRGPSLLIFGSQTSLPTAEKLASLRTTLLQEPALHGLAATIAELQDTWHDLVSHDPDLKPIPGEKVLSSFATWINEGVFQLEGQPGSVATPNLVLTPLTVILHLVEYFRFLDKAEYTHEQYVESEDKSFEGFCTGLLAASALSLSRDTKQSVVMAAAALRLAVAIGAYVDLDEGVFASPAQEVTCVVVRCKEAAQREEVDRLLETIPEAYISVITDINTITITTPKQEEESLIQKLSGLGLSTRTIHLHGRFHSLSAKHFCERILSLATSDPRFRFPMKDTHVHEEIVQAILTEQFDWHTRASDAVQKLLETDPTDVDLKEIISFGLVDPLPRSIASQHADQFRIEHWTGICKDDDGKIPSPESPYQPSDDAIAIVGLSCRFPGADDLDEFWELLKSGASMLGDLPPERFPTEGLRRTPKNDIRFMGNFLRDGFAFDHKFFGRSSRESASMDPQHKLILQVAYEALESAGYFSTSSYESVRDVGCYVGVAASDYEDNVASHAPTAFSVPGMVRAFVSGKISHFFGFSGPALVFDTACSSSAVAIHTACQAIKSGDCSMALAGGVNVITSPVLHQNLAAANFLTPTGASKAFDSRADGYCRGEGAGLVVLKRYSAAVADGDQIHGVLLGSAVNQNKNDVSITVPVSESQTNVYGRVLQRARMDPAMVSFVEAHGTGTPKGDPIESKSIRDVFGGKPTRKLYFGSVKGSIGHTEAASGVAGLIKVLLMMRHRTITPQASFEELNPAIPPLEQDNVDIARTPQRWNAKFLAACVNNYGAAGSNAAMLVCQAPEKTKTVANTRVQLPTEFPFLITSKSSDSLQQYCKTLASWLERQLAKTARADHPQLLAGVTDALARRANLGLPYVYKGSVGSPEKLLAQLKEMAASPGPDAPPRKEDNPKRNRPIVLVFSGQTGNTVSISEDAYRQSSLLQHHLDRCDKTMRKMGLDGILPDIFKQEPITDVIQLHCSLFAVQYSVAKAWIDSGLRVVKLIGHSLGQLTALCVSGAMSLEDGLRMTAGRAELIKNHWGAEKGTMYTVEASRAETQELVSTAQEAGIEVEVACYNAPSKNVVVGSSESISKFEDFVSSKSIRGKKLDVAYGFHSRFVDNIMPGYRALLEQVEFFRPRIPIETCSEGSTWTYVSAALVAEQSRKPVYFVDAVERICQEHGPCVWLEAGSSTAAIPLVKAALQASDEVSQHSFHKVNLAGPGPMASLAATTLGLWDCGVRVRFWPFHSSQRQSYPTLILPPYQFEKHHHRLEYIDRHESEKPAAASNTAETAPPPPPTMVSFVEYTDPTKNMALFDVNTSVHEFEELIKGHKVLGSPLCPVSLYVEMASRAAALIVPDFSTEKYAPHMQDLEILAPLGLDDSRKVQISLETLDDLEWQFTITSTPPTQGQKTRKTRHASAMLRLDSSSDKRAQLAMQRYERLISFKGAESLLSDPHASAMQGPLVYRLFDRVVEYSYIYRGVQKVSSTKKRVSGFVKLDLEDESIDVIKRGSLVNSLAIDNFTQVAGLQVNGMEDCGQDEVFIASQIEELQLANSFNKDSSGPWLVYSHCRQGSERELLHDIFVFDTTTKTLIMTIHGIKFTRTKISLLSRILGKASSPIPATASVPLPNKQKQPTSKPEKAPSAPRTSQNSRKKQLEDEEKAQASLESELKQLLQEVADIFPEDVHPNSVLTEVGIDSLMANEVLAAIEQKFAVTLSASEFQDCENFRSLCKAISARRGDAAPTPTSRSSSVDAGDFAEQASQAIESETAASSVSDGEEDELRGTLYKLLAEHLDVPESDIPRGTILVEAGLDSLSGTELSSDIEKTFGKELDLSDFATVGDIEDALFARKTVPPTAQKPSGNTGDVIASSDSGVLTPAESSVPSLTSSESVPMLASAIEDFQSIRSDYLRFAEQAGWAGFREKVYPEQKQLVFAYVLEAFDKLGCNLSSIKPGQELPDIPHLPRHKKVLGQYYKVLRDEKLIHAENGIWTRSAVPVPDPRPKSKELFEEMVSSFPKFASELKILNATGSKLAEIIDGRIDPLSILFKTKTDRDLLEDVYTNTPMFKTGNMVLENFLCTTLPKSSAGKLQILELGAGTGGTTVGILEKLEEMDVDFTYTFSDLSSSLVAAAKKKFARYGSAMEYAIVDVEKEPPAHMAQRYHIIISSNCIHATKDLSVSSANLHKMLRPQDGMVCLLELTRNLYWLDCVFGTLEGWWLFQDSRTHVLASEQRWKTTLLNAGFSHVDWSDDDSQESDQFRVVVGFTATPNFSTISDNNDVIDRTDWMTTTDTVMYHEVDGVSLEADIYYPAKPDPASLVRPIALMIHGGGHIMLSRKDVRPKQTALLLKRGFLPVSVDYRLCPETTLPDGPTADVCTALSWCRDSLPGLLSTLARPDVRANGSRVVAVGWSTGGTLAMTLAFAAPSRGLAPPDAVLAFYCPTDYEDPFWSSPNFPERTGPAEAEEDYDLLEGVHDQPIVKYNVPVEKRATGGWMSMRDARSRIALHMNWKGQALPTLLDGLPSKKQLEAGEWKGDSVDDWKQRPIPDAERIRAVSPYAQIKAGNYQVPTFLVHGTKDDLIPWEHSQRIRDALLERGVDAGLSVPQGALHLFDLYREGDRGEQARAVLEGYDFLCPYVGLPVP